MIKISKWIPIYISKFILTSFILFCLSINGMAVNSGALVNKVPPKNKEGNALEHSKHQIKQGKLKKRILAFVQKLQPKSSEEEKESPKAARISYGLGIASILSVLFYGGIIGLVAIIFGIIGLQKIKKSKGKLGGRKKAIIGIVMGAISVVLTTVVVIWLFQIISKSM